MWQHWVNLILGLAVVAVPFLALSAATLTWSLVVMGLIIAALGLWGILDTSRSVGRVSDLRHQHQ